MMFKVPYRRHVSMYHRAQVHVTCLRLHTSGSRVFSGLFPVPTMSLLPLPLHTRSYSYANAWYQADLRVC